VAVGPERRLEFYRDRCLKCHQEGACTEAPARRHQKQDSCIACHMPPYAASDIVHIATTDHRIVRVSKPGREQSAPVSRNEIALVPYGRDRLDPADRDVARDLGLALVMGATRGQLPTAPAATQGFSLLRRALKEWPGDVEAWEGCGWAQLLLQNKGEALTHFEEVLARDPDRERSLVGAARAAEKLELPGAARDYWRRAVSVNPWLADYRRGLARVLLRQRDPEGARRQAEAWVRLDPRSVEGRQVWISCLVQQGKLPEARAEFARLEALRPANLEQLRRWFASQGR
jgi:tetratricopeptide (TPR) repeat protein